MEKIKTALCSFGMSGKVFHAPFLSLHPGFELYGVFERSKKLANQFYPDIISFDSLEKMLADEAIDLVIVNTPNYTHYDFAKKSLLAGKHVVVEKSFTVTVSEAEELNQLAVARGKMLAVFQNRRYDSDLKTVKQIIDSQVLGALSEVEFHFDRYKPQLSVKQHKEEQLPGSGLLHDLGPHLIDQALFLFGMPARLSANLRVQRPNSKVNDFFDLLLVYEGFNVRLKSGLLVRELLPAYIVHGINGSFLKMRADVQEEQLVAGSQPANDDWGTEPDSAKGLLVLEKDGKTTRKQSTALKGNYMDFYEGIFRAITENIPPSVTAQDGINVMKIIEAALQSSSENTIVPIF